MASLTRLIFRLTAQLRWPGPPSRSYPMISHMGFHVGYPTLNITGYCRPWAPPPAPPAGDTRKRALTRCACTGRAIRLWRAGAVGPGFARPGAARPGGKEKGYRTELRRDNR